MIPLRIQYEAAGIDLEYDEDDELEVLLAQVQSSAGMETKEVELLDASGRLVENHLDILRLHDEKDSEKLVLVCVDKEKNIGCCTRETVLGEEECIQPAFAIEGTSILLCAHCATSELDSSLTSPVRFLTSIICQSKQAAEIGLLYNRGSEVPLGAKAPAEFDEYFSSVKLYLKKKLYSSALEQQLKTTGGQVGGGPVQDFRRQLDSGVHTVMTYEDTEQQAAARDALDYQRIKEKADEFAQETPDSSEDVRFIVGLLRWFKDDFFKWCNKPACEHADCQAPPSRMGNARMDAPSEFEKQVGWASRVEVYECKECKRETRFARFNKPSHLLKTRRGRCGEWANAFCLVCRALALDARYIRDWTDHVWVEIWVPSLSRFVHCDPCEKTFDAPLSYEKGWNKKLTHVIAFSRYGVSDASPRYSRKLSDVVLRRGAGMEPGALREVEIQMVIATKDKEMEEKFSSAQRAGYLRGASRLRGTFASDSLSLLAAPSRLASGKAGFLPLSMLELRIEDMQSRKAGDRREIASLMFRQAGPDKEAELRGRGSGDAEWRGQRGELGDGKGGEDPLSGVLRDATLQKTSYLPLSGSKHGDTKAFDVSAIILGIAALLDAGDTEGSVPWGELRVSEIAVWASSSFVNGVQVSYETRIGTRIQSPLFLGKGGPTATKHMMALSKDDEVMKVAVRAGAIVDSLTITSKLGKVLKAGGDGGGPPAVIDVAAVENLRFVGFFGGLGGHVHNLGVILDQTTMLPLPPTEVSTTAKASLAAFYSFITNERKELIEWAEGALGEQLLDALRALCVLQKRPELIGQVLDAIVAYNSPLALDPADISKRTVKASNSYFQKNILKPGGAAGIALFCTGPAKFSTEEGALFTSSIRLFHEGGSVGRAEVTRDLESYVSFLQSAKERLAN